MAVTKSYVDSAVNGITYRLSKPSNPCEGDCYSNPLDGNSYVYVGGGWIIYSSYSEPVKNLVPTFEELEKYPSLKSVWEEYMAVRKLVGI